MTTILYLIAAILCMTINSGLAEPTRCYQCAGDDCYNATASTLRNVTCSSLSPFDVVQQIASLFGNVNLTEQHYNTLFGNLRAPGDFQLYSTNWTCVNLALEHEWFGDDRNPGVRTCVPEQLFENDACDTIGNIVDVINGDLSYCTTCDDDSCNSAISLTTIPIVLFSIVAVTLRLIL